MQLARNAHDLEARLARCVHSRSGGSLPILASGFTACDDQGPSAIQLSAGCSSLEREVLPADKKCL